MLCHDSVFDKVVCADGCADEATAEELAGADEEGTYDDEVGAGATEDCHDSVLDQVACKGRELEAALDEVAGATLDCQDSVLEKVVWAGGALALLEEATPEEGAYELDQGASLELLEGCAVAAQDSEFSAVVCAASDADACDLELATNTLCLCELEALA